LRHRNGRDALDLNLQRAAPPGEPGDVALPIEPECERTDAVVLALVEHDDESVSAALDDVAATRRSGGGEGSKPDTVLPLRARPAADLFEQAVHMELKWERSARDGELRRDRTVAARRYHHRSVAAEVDRVFRLHRPRPAADVMRDELQAPHRPVGIQVERIDPMQTAGGADDVLALQLCCRA